MITITIGSTANDVVVTLNERTTLTNPDYFIYVESIETGATATAYAPDTSLSTSRYNEFNFVETAGATPDPQNGELNLITPGYWNYTFYEAVGATPHTVQPASATGIVETGMMFVIGPSTSVFPQPTDSTRIYSPNDAD